MCCMFREHVEREIKVETLRHIVVECDKDSLPALKTQLIAYAGSEWGTSYRTAIEYLNQLVGENSIFIEGNNVWTLPRWLKIEKSRALDYLKMEDIINGVSQHQL